MKKFILLILSMILLVSCVTKNRQEQEVRVNAPRVPELPDLPLSLNNEELTPLFLYMIDVNSTFKEIYLCQQAGVYFTNESIIEELEFAQANLDAIRESLE